MRTIFWHENRDETLHGAVTAARTELGQNDVTAFAFEPGALAMLRFRVFSTENTCKVLRRGVPGVHRAGTVPPSRNAESSHIRARSPQPSKLMLLADP